MALDSLKTTNLRLNLEKYKFRFSVVSFLGHRVDAAGIHTTWDNVRAVVEAPPPNSKQSLQAFLGLLAFYNRFLKQRATVARDLYQLLPKEVASTWEERRQQAFESLKQLLLQTTVLVHYDSDKPLVILYDFSLYGIRAVLAQEDSWEREVPIPFASRLPGPAEWNYVQLDHNALAVVFAAQHFHDFTCARPLSMLTTSHPWETWTPPSRLARFCHLV